MSYREDRHQTASPREGYLTIISNNLTFIKVVFTPVSVTPLPVQVPHHDHPDLSPLILCTRLSSHKCSSASVMQGPFSPGTLANYSSSLARRPWICCCSHMALWYFNLALSVPFQQWHFRATRQAGPGGISTLADFSLHLKSHPVIGSRFHSA